MLRELAQHVGRALAIEAHGGGVIDKRGVFGLVETRVGDEDREQCFQEPNLLVPGEGVRSGAQISPPSVRSAV